MNISIRLIGVYDESWDFSLNYGDEKIKFYQTLYRACEDTSRHYKHTYNENFYTHVGIQKISSLLEEKQIKKELIIIVVSDLLKIRYTWLSSIARHNDIVVLHLLHPYESKPDSYSNILCESRSIEAIPYKKSLFQAKKEIQEYLSSNNVAYISGISTENPVDLLNHFFKYRYAR